MPNPGVPLSMIAFWNSPRAPGAASSRLTSCDPADSPAMVTLFGSPPNFAMFRFTHCSAAIWSIKA